MNAPDLTGFKNLSGLIFKKIDSERQLLRKQKTEEQKTKA